ncbi:MAG: hypothetical protein ACYCOO_06990 [Chitinophagaceae bacterium]
MKTDRLHAVISIDIALDELFVQETLATGIELTKKNQKKSKSFGSVDLWNIRRNASKPRIRARSRAL